MDNTNNNLCSRIYNTYENSLSLLAEGAFDRADEVAAGSTERDADLAERRLLD